MGILNLAARDPSCWRVRNYSNRSRTALEPQGSIFQRLQVYGRTLSGPTIRSYLGALFDAILQQNLLRIVKSSSVV
ncbi:hypothetical protein CY34DRAFT_773626 [Suillus luteus UH-Slu-Lm8-n1]|uniref:Uncharacterized protein n=1 Tax=Suillus luteus UH-Slu-Lm8-n1 TaxID=930992 RepID=A0A0D0A8L9_9AGAM|nr:hypothetical protein CY34DRAFT_773626 [Suillus luteus UH-Slu-Lm8-n1]